MEQIVTGCEKCPLKDSASGEYYKYCNHPDRGIEVNERYIGEDNYFAVREVDEPLKSKLIQDYKDNGVSRVELNGKTYLFYDMPLDLYKSEPYLNYPYWCPLIIEPITIKLKQWQKQKTV